MVQRVYVEKKPGHDVHARALAEELREVVGITGLETLRVFNRYDVEGIDEGLFSECVPCVFAEPQTDRATAELPDLGGAAVFAVEPLPGQFDQRADSAAQCVQLISQGELPTVLTATVYALDGDLSEQDVDTVKAYVINPVECREASLEKPETLAVDYPEPEAVEVLEGFRDLDDAGLAALLADRGLAMDLDDLRFCQAHFRDEGRDPTITEVRVADTYWSDHCRHTTFGTELDAVTFDDPGLQKAWDRYLQLRRELGREDKPVTLMDLGTLGARYLKATGRLSDLDESDEINACTIRCTVDVDGEDQDWLYLFKNETHNHPTEIEPFGGAATCIGGAIRDPLSGRSYVYQAMRVTGAADPTVPVSETLPDKLPQRKLVTGAAEGYSSYGNQIGLATGQVSELYHPGYAAKRMEIGAVVGAAPAANVRREEPAPGDVVVLLGGRTGRDGIGGATGSSKAHSHESLDTCGAEAQKGNAPVERKLQRLFRRPEACRLIKRCNDFGAGGVAVAIGELADGLAIDLDRVPKKYEGLDGTELAISESQERMAVALAPEDVDAFCALAAEENLEATPVATVTGGSPENAGAPYVTGGAQGGAGAPYVTMTWRGEPIVRLSRAFLASNGAPKHQVAHVEAGSAYEPDAPWADRSLGFSERMAALVGDLNVACNRGLAERFDSTIGAGTVVMPFGGAEQLTAPMAMVAKLPVDGETETCSAMAWGFNPFLTEADPYTGAYLAVVESLSRLVAAGFRREDAHLTFQEYFERLRDVPERWGKPVAAVLGALMAQVDLGVGAIGGKDSMSGSFEELDVPPTLVSFATALGPIGRVTSPEFKGAGHRVLSVTPARHREGAGSQGLIAEPADQIAAMAYVERLVGDGAALAVATPGYGGTAEAVFKMCLGNGIGIEFSPEFAASHGIDALFAPAYGTFVVELAPDAELPEAPDGVLTGVIATTTEDRAIAIGDDRVELGALREAWERPLEGVFPYRTAADEALPNDPLVTYTGGVGATYRGPALLGENGGKPRVAIPAFPGTNCELDSARAFERAGAVAETLVIRNLTASDVAASAQALVNLIDRSQILMLPGGFSGGDEPDGSAKFITAFFRAPEVTEAVRRLLNERDGLILGICNGFQALVKLGLVPYGDIRPMDETCPTLTHNDIGRHQSRLVRTRVDSDLSPWLSRCEVGDVHTVAISHGEGRFVAPEPLLRQMAERGQVCTQYVGADGLPSQDLAVNPNGSVWAIEGICSPDGRVFGKMGHSERSGAGLYKNVPGAQHQPIFEGGVAYFA